MTAFTLCKAVGASATRKSTSRFFAPVLSSKQSGRRIIPVGIYFLPPETQDRMYQEDDIPSRVLKFLQAIPRDDVYRAPGVNKNSPYNGAGRFHLSHQWVVVGGGKVRQYAGNASHTALRLQLTLPFVPSLGNDSIGNPPQWTGHGALLVIGHSCLGERPLSPHRYGDAMQQGCAYGKTYSPRIKEAFLWWWIQLKCEGKGQSCLLIPSI
ncbi:hypothetical protein Cgig2_003397 [Carnegiea gigantea]|uniref:Uncharacterized protein n=1 Tax=Carnegiea gigantea TaxID=171969 RepID=A0A9Q1Q4P2_9CARY|nr:hypothetical protein Cgig2_003397 [Carnegiea gigantea]